MAPTQVQSHARRRSTSSEGAGFGGGGGGEQQSGDSHDRAPPRCQVQALNVSLARIGGFLTSPDHQDRTLLPPPDGSGPDGSGRARVVVELKDATLEWPSKTANETVRWRHPSAPKI